EVVRVIAHVVGSEGRETWPHCVIHSPAKRAKSPHNRRVRSLYRLARRRVACNCTRPGGSMDDAALNVSHLRVELGSGRMARNELLEEIERHLDRNLERPLVGALDLVLELLHVTPSDPHVLRVLARLYERDGNARAMADTLERTTGLDAANDENSDDAPS